MERYRLIVESLPVGIFTFDLKGNVTSVNNVVLHFGYKKGEVIGKSLLEFIPENNWPMIIENMADLANGKSTQGEVGIKTKKGTVIMEFRSSPIKKRGKIIGFQSIVADITERKEMEKKLQEYAEHLEEMVEERTKELKESQEVLRESDEILRESEEKYRKVFEEALDAIFLHDAETGIFIDCNRAASELVGREKSELVGTHQRILHPLQDIKGGFSKTFIQHIGEKEGQVLETQVITKKGEIKEVAIKANVFELKGKKMIQGIFRDITERKRMEEQLIKSERLAAIGELATMVGHDLRNPLSALQNACYYLKMKLTASKDGKVRKMFEVIDREINYTNKIINDLLGFSRLKKPEFKKVEIISSIQEALAQLEFPENVKLITKFNEVPTIEADPNQLRRIFQNIAINGVQAMPNGGELTVSTRKNGDFLEVALTDTGIGIPKENMGKLFTPLFTTKAQGVGLGLAICKNLVEGHNGRIEVKSKVGGGSTFTVTLPIHQTNGGEKQA